MAPRALTRDPGKLDVGARREVFRTDGRGGGNWVPAVMVEWGPGPTRTDVGYMIFLADRPDAAGLREVVVRCEPASIGTKLRPITQAKNKDQEDADRS